MMRSGGYTPAQFNSPGTGAPEQKRVRALRPVTIKQLTDLASSPSPDAPLELDGHELATVTFVGCVRKIAEQSLLLQYLIEDGTSSIDVKLYDNVQDGGQRHIIPENTYVRVVGLAKGGNNQKVFVNANAIRPVTDFNEVTYHLMEVMAATLYLTRGPSGQPAPSQQQHQQPGFVGAHQPGQLANTNAYSSYMPQQHQQPHMGTAATGGYGSQFTPVQQRVMDVTGQLGRASEGAHVPTVVMEVVKSGFTESAVRDAVEFLTGEGHIYSTYEDHVQLATM